MSKFQETRNRLRKFFDTRLPPKVYVGIWFGVVFLSAYLLFKH